MDFTPNGLGEGSDSFFYYEKATADTAWFSFFVYGTPFINFLCWPLVKVLSLSYLSVMVVLLSIPYPYGAVAVSGASATTDLRGLDLDALAGSTTTLVGTARVRAAEICEHPR